MAMASVPPYKNAPSAHTVLESKQFFDQRAQSVLSYFANKKLGVYNRETGKSFPMIALAKLKLGVDVDLVNQEILSSSTVPYAKTGTDFTALSPYCVREGDYDFSLSGWVSLLYEMENRPDLLYPETKERIINILLVEKGNKIATHRSFCGFVKIKETENHIILTEGSRYLTNQIWQKIKKSKGEDDSFYDNNKNGMTKFILQDLQKFLKNDFEEYNSRPYQKISLGGIHNIFEYAEDSSVKEMARMVLDYLSVKFASSSRGLRRVVPFCRQPEHKDDLDILQNDALSTVMALYAGDLSFVHQLPESVRLVNPFDVKYALGTYRLNDNVLDLIMNDKEEGREFFQLYHHLGYELYTGNSKYVLNAGGKFINQFDLGTGKTDAWAVPISILPTDAGLDKTQLIRIIGDKRHNKRANMCVTRDFACGLNVTLPDNIPNECLENFGNWTFINFDSPKCPLSYGFYVAVFKKPCDSIRCRLGADNYGFFETKLSSKMSYAEFRDAVLKNNKNKNFKSSHWATYKNSQNENIKFLINPILKNQYPIKDDRNPMMFENMKSWPHAWGDMMSSNGKGVLHIKNSSLQSELIFDVTDIYRPRRYERALQP